jgi:hypothetical protein
MVQKTGYDTIAFAVHNKHTRIEELLEKVFSIQSDLSCYRQLQSVVVDAQ